MSPVSNLGGLSKGVTVKIDEKILTPSDKVTVIVIGVRASYFNGLIVKLPDEYVTYDGLPVNVTNTVLLSGSEYEMG
jgi:hypothetical protein